MFFTCFGKSKVPKRYSTLYRELIESALVHPLRIFAFHHAFPLHFCSISTVVFTSPSHTYFLCLEKRKKKKEEMFDHVFLVHLRRTPQISLRSQIFRVLLACWLLDQIIICASVPRGKTFPAVDHHLLPHNLRGRRGSSASAGEQAGRRIEHGNESKLG